MTDRRIVNFAYNPTSWRDGRPVPGGMADCLVQPILPHLQGAWVLTDQPQPGMVNCYYTFPHTYGQKGLHPDAASVFISHGIADKGWRNRSKVDRFDYVFVSGPAWTRRLMIDGFPRERIVEAGYTKLDPIFAGTVESAWPERDGRIRVLWAPTHGGGGEGAGLAGTIEKQPGSRSRRTTHWDVDQLAGLLPDDTFHVMVARHPRHRPDRRSTLAEYVGADVVIADGGSTIYEAWALGLPVVFPSWATRTGNLAKRPPTFETQIYAQRVGYHTDAPERLPDVVWHAATAGIDDPAVALAERIIPAAYRGFSGRMHAEALDDIAAGREPRHLAAQPASLITFRHTTHGDERTVNIDSSEARFLAGHHRWEEVPA